MTATPSGHPLRHRAGRLLTALGLPVFLVALWWVASAGSTNPFYPPLSTVLDAFGRVWFSDRFLLDVLPSLRRFALGLLLAVLVGVGAGLLVGSSRVLRTLLEPALAFFRALPSPVLVPVLLVLVGVGDAMKIAVIAFGCLWPVLLNTVDGVRGTDQLQLDAARVCGLSRTATFGHLVLPSASPQIAAGIRQALGIGIILMVVSEMVVSTDGLGHAVVRFQRSFALPEMWSGMIFLGLLGFLLAKALEVVERRVLAWHHGVRRATGSPS
ncbi:MULTISPECIES: ABC transporter permease [Micromonospora]|uniref:ABC-type nitrate/sulfonate/bicarbonate transport system, permease component n=1 Tax=Micromonospora yangpuensis TaxID=683228 RepID=A0A1C6UR38_9ACTN|nr:ABC transporter permease subunit [Micromonospora yangpuensis]GGM07275.1 nitrate ABC transporter permease [Micromonospora yangpuensis]SCL56451.1 ABC-type nitrate/sulfonate/bicarbonate transport system, permease component [Micromonospora yangpuensis]